MPLQERTDELIVEDRGRGDEPCPRSNRIECRLEESWNQRKKKSG
jgi:hypothetical protein